MWLSGLHLDGNILMGLGAQGSCDSRVCVCVCVLSPLGQSGKPLRFPGHCQRGGPHPDLCHSRAFHWRQVWHPGPEDRQQLQGLYVSGGGVPTDALHCLLSSGETLSPQVVATSQFSLLWPTRQRTESGRHSSQGSLSLASFQGRGGVPELRWEIKWVFIFILASKWNLTFSSVMRRLEYQQQRMWFVTKWAAQRFLYTYTCHRYLWTPVTFITI